MVGHSPLKSKVHALTLSPNLSGSAHCFRYGRAFPWSRLLWENFFQESWSVDPASSWSGGSGRLLHSLLFPQMCFRYMSYKSYRADLFYSRVLCSRAPSGALYPTAPAHAAANNPRTKGAIPRDVHGQRRQAWVLSSGKCRMPCLPPRCFACRFELPGPSDRGCVSAWGQGDCRMHRWHRKRSLPFDRIAVCGSRHVVGWVVVSWGYCSLLITLPFLSVKKYLFVKSLSIIVSLLWLDGRKAIYFQILAQRYHVRHHTCPYKESQINKTVREKTLDCYFVATRQDRACCPGWTYYWAIKLFQCISLLLQL